jgi:hypothetical protein
VVIRARLCQSLNIIVGIALLAGCSGSQPPIGAPGAMPLSRAIAKHAAHGKSWMLPEASSDDLVYVSNLAGTVTVYDYQTLQIVGTLTGFVDPSGLCVDNIGNIWVTDYGNSRIVEYAHGGTKAINKLSDPRSSPIGCSIDPTTGNLAVANYKSPTGAGNIAIYPNAKNPPTTYQAGYDVNFWSCMYDKGGNLLTNGVWISGSYSWYFYLLSKGASSLTQYYFGSDRMWEGGPPTLNWDGKDWAVPAVTTIYRYKLKKSRHAKLRGRTSISDDASAYLPGYWISPGKIGSKKGQRLFVTEESPDGVGIFPYPQGGAPLATVSDGLDSPFGVAVSLSPSR